MSPAKKPSRKKAAAAKKSSGGKTAAKKATSKKAAPKKTAVGKTAKKAAAKKTAAKKTAAKKTAAKKTAAKKTAAKKTAAKKTATKKTAAKKNAVKKTAAKKTARTATSSAPKTTAGTGPKRTTGTRTALKATAAGPSRPPAPARRVRPASFTKEELAGIRQRLTQELEDLRRQQEELEQPFEGSQSETTGEVGLDEDFADAGTATFERERDLSIRNNIQDLIGQIGRAIARIDEGKYGICERCGQPIDAARLKALPHALLCMDCKRRDERAR